MRRLLLATLLAAALAAGDAAPLVQLRAADGPDLQQAWERSLYGQLWQDPAFAELRRQVLDAARQTSAETGVDPWQLIREQRGLTLQVLPGREPKKFRVLSQVDLGAQAKAVFARIASPPQSPPKQRVAVPGADEAVRHDEAVTARFGNVLVVAINEGARRLPSAPATAALAIDIDAPAILAHLAAIAPPAQQADIRRAAAQLQPFLGRLSYRGDLVSEGVRERITSDQPLPGAIAVDRALLARLPTNTLLLLASGIDGREYWRVASESLLTMLDVALHEEQPQGLEATRREVDQLLAARGVQGGLQALVEGLRGTALIALTPAAPFPALTLALPRSPQLDALVAAALAQAPGNKLPPPGKSGLVRLPDVELPAPLQLVHGRTHWVFTTDALLAMGWESGRAGGFADSAAARAAYGAAAAEACIIGVSDTPQVLRTLHGFLGMLLMLGAMDPETQQAVAQALLRTAELAQPGYLVAANTAQGAVIEARGLLGTGLIPVLLAGSVFAITSDRAEKLPIDKPPTLEAPKP
ncbi:MAG: hypothetical protein RMM29_00635 [Planctomycetota bacterium]|nr:hypothetical protein [Planctomycetota bacterium]